MPKTGPWQRQLFLEQTKPSTCIKHFSEIESRSRRLGPANYTLGSWTEDLTTNKNYRKGTFSNLKRFKEADLFTNFRPSSSDMHDFKKPHTPKIKIGQITARTEQKETGSKLSPASYDPKTIKFLNRKFALSFESTPTGNRFRAGKKPLTHSCPFYDVKLDASLPKMKNCSINAVKLPDFARSKTSDIEFMTNHAVMSMKIVGEDKFSKFGTNQRRFFRTEKETEFGWNVAGPGRYNQNNDRNTYASEHVFNSSSLRHCLK